ncbi:mitochondrial transcription rescue factor 1-like [Paramacrobiotus metropolitanus]|uniref:mitochondrial transcription rescue factor 1-like n=1 Tax=Paramacrobiotus metropolitanus TaxID=2943436 RepID=UPI002445D478|nr:mitochondrial transcription rescue factor 1-like [Paramacrobiotus metropolitanus]
MTNVSRSAILGIVSRYCARLPTVVRNAPSLSAGYLGICRSAAVISTGSIHTLSPVGRLSINSGSRRPSLAHSQLVHPWLPVSAQMRGYARKKSGAKTVEKDEDETGEDEEGGVLEDDDDDGEVKDWKDVKVNVSTARIDNIMKTALNANRAKIEEGFMENRIRVNGEKVHKKSGIVALNDEMDYIIGISNENPDMLEIMRVQVLGLEDTTMKGKLPIYARIWKKLLVPNYKGSNKYTLSG